MREGKLLELLEKEFGDGFIISTENNNTEFYIDGCLCDYAFVSFRITQKYLLEAFVVELGIYPHVTTTKLSTIKLETEEQIVEFIKTGYTHLVCEYNI